MAKGQLTEGFMRSLIAVLADAHSNRLDKDNWESLQVEAAEVLGTTGIPGGIDKAKLEAERRKQREELAVSQK